MDREERTPIFEPILLILKQRTGIASIISFLIAGFLSTLGFSPELILVLISPILIYVGKQGLVDANETGAKHLEQFNELRREVLETVDLLLGDFVVEQEEDEAMKAQAVREDRAAHGQGHFGQHGNNVG